MNALLATTVLHFPSLHRFCNSMDYLTVSIVVNGTVFMKKNGLHVRRVWRNGAPIVHPALVKFANNATFVRSEDFGRVWRKHVVDDVLSIAPTATRLIVPSMAALAHPVEWHFVSAIKLAKRAIRDYATAASVKKAVIIVVLIIRMRRETTKHLWKTMDTGHSTAARRWVIELPRHVSCLQSEQANEIFL